VHGFASPVHDDANCLSCAIVCHIVRSLAEFTQVDDNAWYVDGEATLVEVSSASTFNKCVADCKQDANCQYIVYDYNELAITMCNKKQAGTGR
jgi:hypothetical protein